MSPVVTRFAPSPTGLLHAGNYRTAVFAYLFAKRMRGSFVVRIEDTDAARSKPEYTENIFDALAWLNLPADATYTQSAHRARHRTLLEKLVADNTAYVSKETPEKPGDRDEVIRFRNTGETVIFTDVIRGEIATNTSDLGDFIIARSFDEPVFHFAVVVDDADEQVTHVIRGGDHISNTARQILLQRALGLPTPLYAHLPLIMDNSHKKLSKRTGARALTEYRSMGILPEALLNYLSLLGWNPGDEREYLSRDELIAAFDLARVQKGSAVFDEVKLFSINQHWMRTLSVDSFIERLDLTTRSEYMEYVLKPSLLEKAVPLLKERARTFSEAREILKEELAFLFVTPTLDASLLRAKEPVGQSSFTKTALQGLLKSIEALPEDVSAEVVKEAIMPLANAEEAKGKGGRGATLWPLRYALSGKERSPDPFSIIAILGKDASLARVQQALAML